jgi:hypothetical protein
MAKTEDFEYGVERELIRWHKGDGEETIKLEMSLVLKYNPGDKGVIPKLRSAASETITGLLRDLANAKRRAKTETTVQVSLDDVPGKPYKASNIMYGEEVPGVPWTPGGPHLPTEPPEQTKE